LTSPAGAEAARFVPEVDDVIVYDATWLKSSAPRSGNGAVRPLVDSLRGRGFDGAVIFTVYTQSPLPAALLCYLAAIPLRLAHCRENPYQLLTHWVRETEPSQTIRHEVRHHLDLVEAIGCRTSVERLSLHLPAIFERMVCQLLDEVGLDVSRPWLAVHTGATAPSRRYPGE
jgi:ADP-heptose:LPS heptosyltransferase